MEISASLVKELREKTGVGMMECKKALSETDGNIEKAIVYLRERGMSRAAKKADRIVTEGVVEVITSDDRKRGVVLEVNCETDFVAKNEDFKRFVQEAAQLTLKNKTKTIEDLSAVKTKQGQTVADVITELVSKIGENIKLRRVSFHETTNGAVAGYIHMGGKIGSLVVLEGASNDKVFELGKDLAMHVAAAAPKYLTRDEVETQELEQEKEIHRKKLKEEGKPDNLIDKIIGGQLNKFYKEVCLVDQPFIKDPNVSVEKLVSSSGLNVKLTAFVRFKLGEGLQKKSENFAEEVAAQIQK